MMFLDYLYGFKGLSVGYRQLQPSFIANSLPLILGELYGREFINEEQFLMYMPIEKDIPEFILPALVYKFRPVFVDKQDYNGYFKKLISNMKSAGKYLYSPLVTPEVR